MTDFRYPPEYTVGHGSTETPKVDMSPWVEKLRKLKQSPAVQDLLNPKSFPLPDKMPFLPLEQLPEGWKDGRSVLMEEVHDDGKSYAVCYYGGDGWYVTYGLRLFTPTHFCPIPLE